MMNARAFATAQKVQGFFTIMPLHWGDAHRCSVIQHNQTTLCSLGRHMCADKEKHITANLIEI